MDVTTLQLLFRLSMAVVVLVLSLVGIVAGVQLPLGRAVRGFAVVGLLGSVVGIVLLTTSLSRRRQAGSPLAPLTPDALVQEALRAARESSASLGARSSATRHRRRRVARVREAEHAAAEAAEDDERLAPEHIKVAAEALVRLVYIAWDARDPKRLATLLSPELLDTWERALRANDAAGVHFRARIRDDVKIDLVGLGTAAGGGHSLIVLVEAELDVDVNDRDGRRVAPPRGSPLPRRLCQYWTLALGDGPMIVQTIEERALGDRHLSEPSVALAHG